MDHRVRLPDEPARQDVRRLVQDAGQGPVAVVRDRTEKPAHRHDAVVPRARRAVPRQLAVGAGADHERLAGKGERLALRRAL